MFTFKVLSQKTNKQKNSYKLIDLLSCSSKKKKSFQLTFYSLKTLVFLSKKTHKKCFVVFEIQNKKLKNLDKTTCIFKNFNTHIKKHFWCFLGKNKEAKIVWNFLPTFVGGGNQNVGKLVFHCRAGCCNIITDVDDRHTKISIFCDKVLWLNMTPQNVGFLLRKCPQNATFQQVFHCAFTTSHVVVFLLWTPSSNHHKTSWWTTIGL